MLRGRSAALLGLALVATGCHAGPGEVIILGQLRTERGDLSRFGSQVIVRAVPDHIDGFSPSNPYTGPRVYEATCPLEHTEFPVEFSIFDDDRHLERAPPRWLLLAWIADDLSETWVEDGALFGAATFEFRTDYYGASVADGIVIDLDQVYGAEPPADPPRVPGGDDDTQRD